MRIDVQHVHVMWDVGSLKTVMCFGYLTCFLVLMKM